MNFEKINEIVEGQRIYFNSQKTKNIDFRLNQLDILLNAINKNEYKIDYSNISNSLINLITCSFNVDYFDLIKDVKESFLNVKLSSVGDKSHYEIGGIVIEI